jgi:Holliday junction resolvasome RuvABC ATP-dependent DNA helicase subunit
MSGVQEMKAFFDPTAGREYPGLPARPTEAEVNDYMRQSALKRIIVGPQNKTNFKLIELTAFSILNKWNRNPRGNNFAIYCPPGQGKSFIVKQIASTLNIIFVFVQSASIDNLYTLFEQIKEECAKYGTPIQKHKTDRADYLLPPMIIFFDEAHKLPMALMKAGLLNAMEPDDCIMVVREPRTANSFKVDCWNVLWAAATTDRGDLFDAFEQRLVNPIKWAPATVDELPVIIKAGLDAKLEHGELNIECPTEACKLIPSYQKVPRLAIHRFGNKMVQLKQKEPGMSWEACCVSVSEMLGLDRFGMTRAQLALLQALGQRPIAEARLGNVCGCRAKEVSKYELPGLQQYYDGGPFVSSVSGRGMCITKSGLEQLNIRGITHEGERITAEYFEEKR